MQQDGRFADHRAGFAPPSSLPQPVSANTMNDDAAAASSTRFVLIGSPAPPVGPGRGRGEQADRKPEMMKNL